MEKRFIISVAASDLKTTHAAVARNFGGNRYRVNQRVGRHIAGAIQTAHALVEPNAIFGLHPVKMITSRGRIVLANGLHVDLPCPPENVQVSQLAAVVATLGPRLEKACRQLSAGGQIYKAALLDAVGTCQLEVLVDLCRRRLQTCARQENTFCGVCFAPGLNGCDLTRQSLLFQLADAQSIGVWLNPDCIMTPLKSVSMFGLFTSTPPETGRCQKCRSCDLTECQFRFEGNSPAEAHRSQRK